MSRARCAGALILMLFAITFAAAPAAKAETNGQQRAQEAGRALLGAHAPRLVLTTIDGETIDLGTLYGKKAVYLKFWATWCVPCRQQMPHFQHVYETAGPDLAVIAIDVGFNDSIEAVRAFRKKLGISMPIVFDDGRLDSAFHLRVTPTHIVIGRDGDIRYVGHLADEALDAALFAARSPSKRAATGTGNDADLRQAAAFKQADRAPVSVGDWLPRQVLQTVEGGHFELRPKDSPRLTALVFLSPWCESYLATTRPEVAANCRNLRMQFTALAKDKRVRWLGVASGLWSDADDLRKYRDQYKMQIPLTLDVSGDVFRTFRVNDVPTVLIADAGGRLVRRLEGADIKDETSLRSAIDGTDAGK